MFLKIIALVVLAALYGLAWHNQPAREPVVVRRSSRRQASQE
jgi:hypothetical protein